MIFDPLSDEQHAELNGVLAALAATRHANAMRRRSARPGTDRDCSQPYADAQQKASE